MAIDIDREELLTVVEAAKVTPRRPSARTIWRWLEHGCRGVVLESVLIGGRRFTTREAIERFLRRVNDSRHNPRSENAIARRCQIDRAEAELAKHGL